jgi:hypothetical protein
VLVDSAATIPAAVVAALLSAGWLRRTLVDRRRRVLLATDGRERFARVGQHFLGEALSASVVELVDL